MTRSNELKAEDIARLIDVSTVRTPHGEAEIRQLVRYARQYRFISVHALPCWVSLLSDLLAADPDIYVGAPIGFPSGAHKTRTKLVEAEQLLADGAQEMDLMINVGMLRSGRFDYVEDEIKAVVQIAGDVEIKVILEVHCLTEDEIKKACELSINAGAAFVKTSTGWLPGGATLETVSLISNFVGDAVKIKASGGKFPFAASGKARAIGETDGFVKVIFDSRYRELLGAHIIGPQATELIAEFGLAKDLECNDEEITHTIHAHPTLSEAALEATLNVFQGAIHI